MKKLILLLPLFAMLIACSTSNHGNIMQMQMQMDSKQFKLYITNNYDDLNADSGKLAKNIAVSLDTEISTLSKSNTEFLSKIKKLEQIEAGHTLRLKKIETLEKRLKSTADFLTNINKVNKKISYLTDHISNISSKIGGIDRQIASLKKSKNKFQSKLYVANKVQLDDEQEIKRLSDKIINHENRIKSLKKQRAKLFHSVNPIKSKLSFYQKNRAILGNISSLKSIEAKSPHRVKKIKNYKKQIKSHNSKVSLYKSHIVLMEKIFSFSVSIEKTTIFWNNMIFIVIFIVISFVWLFLFTTRKS